MWNLINKNDIEFIKREINSKFTDNGEPIFPNNEYIFYETDDKCVLPRYIDKYINPNNRVQKKIIKTQSENININFIKELKEEQKLFIDEIISKKIKGIIVARPGFGKTVIGSYMSHIYKKKTAIIINNTKLVDQWKKSFLYFTDIKEEEISIVQRNNFDTENKKVFIFMVQTLASKLKTDFKKYLKFIKNLGIDLVLYDEVHEVGACPKWSATTAFFETENLFGLTATPIPSKSMNRLLLKFCIGDIIVRNRNYELETKYIFKTFSSNFRMNYDLLNKMIKSNYLFGKSKYNVLLETDENHRNTILKICLNEIKKNHIILILVRTINQLEGICDYLKLYNLDVKKFYSKSKEVDESNTKILIATSRMASKGFDFKDLSCLILANPLKSRNELIQSVGRIVRTKDNNINHPVVYDLIDDRIFEFIKEKKYKIDILSEEFKNKIKFETN